MQENLNIWSTRTHM